MMSLCVIEISLCLCLACPYRSSVHVCLAASHATVAVAWCCFCVLLYVFLQKCYLLWDSLVRAGCTQLRCSEVWEGRGNCITSHRLHRSVSSQGTGCKAGKTSNHGGHSHPCSRFCDVAFFRTRKCSHQQEFALHLPTVEQMLCYEVHIIV